MDTAFLSYSTNQLLLRVMVLFHGLDSTTELEIVDQTTKITRETENREHK